MADYEGKIKAIEARVENLEELTGGGPVGYETITVEYTHYGDYVYYGSFIVSLGVRANRPGDNVGVTRVWANDQIIYDRKQRFVKPQSGFRFWDGREERGIWSPRLMAYKGLMCLQFTKMNLTDYGNSYPAISVELADDVTGFNGVSNWSAIPAFGGPLSGNVELHSDLDTIFYEYWVQEYAIDFTPLLAKERLSTGVRYFSERMGGDFGGVLTPDIEAFGPDIGGGEVEQVTGNLNTIVTHIPAMGLMFACGRNEGAVNPNALTCLSMENPSNTLGSIDMGFEANSLISFKNTTNDFTDWYVVAANEESGEYKVIRVTDGYMYIMGNGSIAGGIAAFQPAKQTKSFRELFIADKNGTVYCKWITKNSVSDGGSLVVQAGANTIRGLIFDPSLDLVVALGCTNPATNKGYAVRINSSPVFLPILVRGIQSDEIDVPPIKRLRAHNAQSTSDTSGATMLFEAGTSTVKLTYLDLATLDAAIVETSSNFQQYEYFGLVWDSRTEVGYFTGGQKVSIRVPVDFDGPDALTAADVMRAFAVYAGFPDNAITTEGMDDMPLLGYVVTGDTSLSSISSAIGDLYGFTWTESAGRLLYRAIYESGELRIDETIPADRMAYITEGMENPQTMTADRQGDVGLPVSISLSYFNPARAHTAGYQVARRNSNPTETQKAVQPMALSMPITITNDYALELLYGAIYRVWASRVTYTARLPSEYMRLDATDTIEFTAEGFTYQAQINRMRINADNSIALDLSEVAGSSYPVQVATQPQIDIPSAAEATTPRVVILDIPNTDETQDQIGYLNWLVIASAYRAGDRFGNSTVQFTDGSDQNEWTTRVSFTADEMGYIGTIINYLPAPADPFVLDVTNSIFMKLDTIPTSKLLAATEDDLDGGANLIAIGSGQYCELIQFANAEPSTPAGVWRLFNLRRGRYGTYVNAGIVAQQSPLSFLDNAKLINYTASEFERGETFYWRSVAQNQPAWQLDRFPITGNGNSRRPYAPNSLKLTRNEFGDIEITWNLTPRFYNSPPEEFPVDNNGGDNLETRVEFFNDAGVVYRVLEGYFGQCTYESFLVSGDGNSERTQLNVRVRQYASDTIDLGFAAGGYGVPVYNAGDADININIDGAGSVDLEPVLTFDAGDIRGLSIDGGGSVDLGAILPGIIVGNINGGGSIEITPVAVAGGDIRLNIDGGGSVTTSVRGIKRGHRYWRMRLLGGVAQLYNMTFHNEFAGPNIAVGGTPIANTGVPGNAFDGDIDSGGQWYADAIDSWLGYDFGEGNEPDIVEYTITRANSGNFITTFVFEYSDDGATWFGETLERPTWATNTITLNRAPYYDTKNPTRHLRIFGHSSYSSLVDFYEILPLPAYGGTFPLTLVDSETVATSSANGIGDGPMNAIDGNFDTVWTNSNPGDNWYDFDFVTPKTVYSLKFFPRITNRMYKDFTVTVSNDGITYYIVKEVRDIRAGLLGDAPIELDLGSPEPVPMANPGLAHRYWRVKVLAIAGAPLNGSINSLREIRFYEIPGGTDVATGGVAIGSIGNYANVFDRNDSTVWETSGYNFGDAWAGYDFGTPKTIREIAVLPNGGGFQSYVVESSDDLVTWNDEHWFDFDVSLPYQYNRLFPRPPFTDKTKAFKHWGITVHSPTGSYWSNIRELEMYAEGSTVNVLTGSIATDRQAVRGDLTNAPRAIDGDLATVWDSGPGDPTGWLAFELPAPVAVRKVTIKNNSTPANTIYYWSLVASDDGFTWYEIERYTRLTLADTTQEYDVEV